MSNINDFATDSAQSKTFIQNLFERKKAQVIRQASTCLLADGIRYTGADSDWDAIYNTVREYAGTDLGRWARYNPILQRYSDIPTTILTPELKALVKALSPLVNEYKDNLLISSDFERKRKQFLSGLRKPNYIRIKFSDGEITEVAVRRGSAIFKLPNLFLHLINIKVNGKVELNLGIVNDGQTVLQEKSYFDSFLGADAEITISRGPLFTTLRGELKEIAEMGEGVRGAVAGIERNSYNNMLIRQLDPLYMWYRKNDIHERTLYTYTEFLNGLFNLNFSERYISSLQGRTKK